MDEGLISEEMCQDGPAGDCPARLRYLTINWARIALLSLNVPRAGSYIVRWLRRLKPLGADGDPDFGVYDAQGLIGPDFADLTFQD